MAVWHGAGRGGCSSARGTVVGIGVGLIDDPGIDRTPPGVGHDNSSLYIFFGGEKRPRDMKDHFIDDGHEARIGVEAAPHVLAVDDDPDNEFWFRHKNGGSAEVAGDLNGSWSVLLRVRTSCRGVGSLTIHKDDLHSRSVADLRRTAHFGQINGDRSDGNCKFWRPNPPKKD